MSQEEDRHVTVSIILPTYNRLEKLQRAIQSILDQTYTDYEVVVINDCSPDGTQAYLTQYQDDPRFVIINNEQNLRLQKSLNKAVNKASGKYLARLDDDDYWTDKTKLEKQMVALHANPEVGLIGTYYTCDEEQISYPLTDAEIRNQMLFRCPFRHSTIIMSRAAYDMAEGYREDLGYIEDWDMWMKIGKNHQMMNLPIYSTHVSEEDNMTAQYFTKQTEYIHDLLSKHGSAYPRKFTAKLYLYFVQLFFTIAPLNGRLHTFFQKIHRTVFAKS